MDLESEIELILKKKLANSSHDLEHTYRVLSLAMRIADTEPSCNKEVLRLACLLHDIARADEDADGERRIDHAVVGAEIAEQLLTKLGVSEPVVKQVAHCIRSHRYRGKFLPESLEAKILSDADKLDAIGAIGVARAFMIAGEWGEPIYLKFQNEDQYLINTTEGRIKNQKEHSPNIEFEVKLKNIPERLYTEKAKQMARDRIAFMREFFTRIEREIKGEL